MGKKILFLCTGNAARSQIAEGFARVLGGGRWEVYSAGTAPASLHPLAVRVMAEAGVDISGHFPKALDLSLPAAVDVVVTLCGDAAESCPATPPTVRRVHWPLPDPARAAGPEALTVFREVRDEIRQRVEQFLSDEG